MCSAAISNRRTTLRRPEREPELLEERFERTALKRLGGSIAFVSKKKVMWDLKDKI